MRIVCVLLAFVASVLANPATAQTEWPVGPVTPQWSDTIVWTPPYDPLAALPADASEPPVHPNDNVIYDRSLWTDTGDQRTNIGLPAGDGKFRTNAKDAFIVHTDPVRHRGMKGMGHPHVIVGANHPYVQANFENADYNMLREYASSSAQGGPLNGSAYGFPVIYSDRSGIPLALLSEVVTFYYTLPGIKGKDTTRLRRHWTFQLGNNPEEFNDTERRAEYAAAGLEYPGSPTTPAGFYGIQCVPDATGAYAIVEDAHALQSQRGFALNDRARYIVGPEGVDPWAGRCTTGHFIINLLGPDCWDATNATSPNNRDHNRYSTRDEDNEPGPGQCPSNYVKVVHLEVKKQYNHEGWADYRHWYSSSDRMPPEMTVTPGSANDPVTQGDPASLDPCRRTGPYFCALATAHSWWINGWDYSVYETWADQCNDTPITAQSTIGDWADCGSGGLDTSLSIKIDGPPPQPGLSTNPIGENVTERAGTSVQGQRYFPIEEGLTGTAILRNSGSAPGN